jgi:hypothetical protein
MGKRASSNGVPRSPKKRVRADPVLAAVAEVVMEAEQLPERCRSMLRDMLPFSLSIPSDKRHEAQTWVVSTVEQLLGSQKSSLQAAIAAEEARLSELRAQEAASLTSVKEAEAALDAQTSAVAQAMVSRTGAMTTACEALTEGKPGPAQKRLECAQEEKAALEKAFQEHYQAPVQEGTGPHFKELQPFLKHLKMDQSLFGALPASCKKLKEERGSFDDVVLKELEKALTSYLSLLGDIVAVETPIAALQKKQAECEEAMAKAVRVSAEQRPQLDAAKSALEEAQVALTMFESGTLAGFTTYKNRVDVSPELAPGGA